MKRKAHATRTDWTGTGYYKTDHGEYLYGNPHNGYLTKTKDQMEREAAKRPKKSPRSSYTPSSSSSKRSSGGSVSYDSSLSPLEVLALILTAGGMAIFMAVTLVVGTVLAILGTW